MTKKYTPGPWVHVAESDDIDCPNAVMAGCYYIASIYDSGADDEEQAEANARLISCAPELLEMLDKIIEDCYNNNFVASASFLREADRLIAKATAEGES